MSIAADYASFVDVLWVYVTEAHPSDEWAMNDGFDPDSACWLQPRTIEQRNKVAQAFADRYQLPKDNFVLDNMTNDLNRAYSAEPERLYVVDGNGNVVFVGGLGPFNYDVDEVRRFLDKALKRV